jgi:hypothetical protein
MELFNDNLATQKCDAKTSQWILGGNLLEMHSLRLSPRPADS